jgi:hypothetical protein
MLMMRNGPFPASDVFSVAKKERKQVSRKEHFVSFFGGVLGDIRAAKKKHPWERGCFVAYSVG